MSEVMDLKCPGCHARVAVGQKICDWCHNPISISTMSDIFKISADKVGSYTKSYETDLSTDPGNAEVCNSLAFCYIKMGLYDKALEKFETAIEKDLNNPETYIFAAACLLAGKKPFVTPRQDIDKIETYINAALSIEEKGIYRYFQTYIKQDYFKRKFLKTSPTWEECLTQAKNDGLSSVDVEQLFSLLKQEIPSVLKIS